MTLPVAGASSATFQQVRAFGVHVEGVVLQAEAPPRLPEVDPAHFRTAAAAKTART
ncbi:MAG: hypothetical protein QN187_12655 [Armatimonadota bacterium]|nr:hypothetical protein [Armatimonadota bacterium]MDR7520574.1 hypothetical protein [Armatimonadota bacterium]MDR7549719.1 hypothetical protein [Armatimonadota bacterium]